MGNCSTLPVTESFYAPSRFSSCRSSSLCRKLSSESVASVTTPSSRPLSEEPASIPRKILPFPAARDFGNTYQLGDELGKGKFGLIRVCKCRATGALYACKSISKIRYLDRPNILREVRAMQLLSLGRAANLNDQSASRTVRLHEVIEDDSQVHIVMELCRGGDLFSRILKQKCFSEQEAALILKSLMESIEFCRSMGLMHRDVKPENILFLDDSDTCIKLADFGLSVEFSPEQNFSDFAGSPYYIAPEVLKGQYTQEIDVWSAGVVLYIMLSGVPPFNGETDDEIFDSIREGKLEFVGSRWDKVSFPVKNLIMKMLSSSPTTRPTPRQVLEHPWIRHHFKAVQKHVQTKLVRKDKKTEDHHVFEFVLPHQHALSETSSSILNKIVHMRVKKDNSEDTASQNQNDQRAMEIRIPLSIDPENTPCKERLLADPVAQLKEKKIFKLADCRATPECNRPWSCLVRSIEKSGKMVAFDFGDETYLVTYNNMDNDVGWKIIQCEKNLRVRAYDVKVNP
ncbi:hypothetical protein KP509_36G004500 [Ceratopteris richardii]|uniref:Protein kinase domain-containing protein n=1 Tax=Ceratopteris richardii TaxID=49495 RepID=A0A8T2QAC7_CERRI|nr:hypothetical protein KP509_36G004500 [Ceratopteris richardii]